MLKLKQSLSEHHLIVLRVIGEWYDLDLIGKDREESAEALTEVLLQLDLTHELNFLQPEEGEALRALVSSGGRMPVAAFERAFGTIREMGPARLEREEPWFNPVSPAEALLYRGLLFRGFDETDNGLVEFFYLADEQFAQFAESAQPASTIREPLPALDLPASSSSAHEHAAQPAPDYAPDDLTTLLGFTQLGISDHQAIAPLLLDSDPTRLAMLQTLALELSLLRKTDDRLRPTRAAVAWLRNSRGQQLISLAQAWRSSAFNELCHVPQLECEGSGWQNDPLLARRALLDILPRDDRWVEIDALITIMKEINADFQRPDGNYDTWYIRDRSENSYLSGFASWDRVEGRLLRYLLLGPMVWLGLIDRDDQRVRLTALAVAWLADREWQASEVDLPVVVQPDATLIVPRQASRYIRFQAMRIAEPTAAEPITPYRLRITPGSLEMAHSAGIQAQRVLQFLQEAARGQVPAGVRRAVTRWSENGTEARLEPVVVLRVRDANVIETLRRNPKTRDYIGESLGDLAAVVRKGDWQKLRDITAQLGLLMALEED